MKKLIAAYLFCCLMLLFGSPALASSPNIYDNLSVDSSNCKNGTIKVAIVDPGLNARYKLGVALKGQCYYYDLDPEQTATIPLQMGKGAYLLLLFKEVTDSLYDVVCQAKVYAKPDPNHIWLEPNVKVNFESPDIISRLQREMKRIGLSSSAYAKYRKIADYTRYGFGYDYITVFKHLQTTAYVDLDRVITRRLGLCEELSALTVALLRIENIPARLVIGRANGVDHAWVETFIDDETMLFDPSLSESRQEEVTYIPQRYY